METSIPQLELGFDGAVLTVTGVTQRVAEAVGGALPGPVWVRGEVSNFRGRNQKGHMYFSLKDENALLQCAFFARLNATLDFELGEGMEVLAYGRIDVYAKYGLYQLIVERLLPGGAGQLYLQFEQRRQKLAAEGLFEAARKRPLPEFANVIGIVTSPTGAVIRDILKILNRRMPFTRVLLAPTPVQGEAAAPAIVRAIELLNRCPDPKVEVIVLARGGGSIEELWPFNEESVARAIFASAVPVVSAIGHETDFTIADFVADQRAATPTHAAEMVSGRSREELLRELIHIGGRLFQGVAQEVEITRQRLRRCRESTVLRFPEKIVADARQTLDRLLERLDHRVTIALQDRYLTLLRPSERLQALNPLKVMERGFALAQKPSGELVRSYQQLTAGQTLNVRFSRGGADCRVERVVAEEKA